MANERRIVELVIKATGDEELKRIARDMESVRKSTEQTTKEINSLNKSFLGVSAAAAGAFVGNKIQEAIGFITNTVSEAIEEMDELATSGEAAGSALNQAAIGGAVEFTNAIEAVSEQVDKATKELVGGLAPALTTLVQMFGQAITSGNDFYTTGQNIGRMLIDVVKWFVEANATIQAYANSVSLATNAISHAISSTRAFISGNLDAAVQFKRAAALSAQAAEDYFRNAQAIGKARAAEVESMYRQAQAAAVAFRPSAAPAKAGGGRARGGGGASAKSEQERLGATQADIALDKELLAVVTDLADAYYEAQAAQAKYIDGLNRAADPTIAFAEGVDKLNQAQAAGGLSAAAYGLELQRLYDQLNKASEALVANSQAERDRKKAEEERRKQLQEAADQWGFLADAMGQATYDIISGTEKIGQAVRRMVAQLIADLVRLSLMKAAQNFLGGLFGGIDFFSAKGNAFGAGGLITGPTLHGTRGGGIGMAGEAGPEAILPLQRNASGQLGVSAAPMNVTVNNNVPGAAVNVRQTDQGLQIDLIERQLADRVRRGGTSLPGALENTYRNGRFASAY